MTVPTEVAELIAGEALSAHVATAVEDRPHVAPVWYAYDDGVLSVLTGGRKLANVRQNPRVAVSIEKLREGAPIWMVAMQGTAAVIEDPIQMQAARERIFPKYERGETDGGATGTNGGGDADEKGDEPTNALIEISIGSATVQRY
jgi:nitroimidazol reductase NimA-like FMN-containing flavoprotein (pyridoxamine 5'-phosphate oxidase superfamily)